MHGEDKVSSAVVFSEGLFAVSFERDGVAVLGACGNVDVERAFVFYKALPVTRIAMVGWNESDAFPTAVAAQTVDDLSEGTEFDGLGHSTRTATGHALIDARLTHVFVAHLEAF